MALAFVPISSSDLKAWASDGVLTGPHDALSVTPALVEAFDFADTEDEAAEHEALCEASAVSLSRYGRRLVVVAETPVEETSDIFGRVQVGGVPYDAVISIFRDDTEGVAAAAIAADVRGLTLEDLLDRVDVQRLLSTTELLWYGPTEWLEAVTD